MRLRKRVIRLVIAADPRYIMNAADKRIAELLDRWLASVELHARYLELDAAAYAKVQAWPKHERPTRWVVELARTRLNELKRLHAEHVAKGDPDFAESLELMGFLTNLVGSEHVERFIPLAVAPPQPSKPREPARQDAAAVDPTIEQTAPQRTRAASAPGRNPERSRAPARIGRKPPAPAEAEALSAGLEKLAPQVIADAVRMLNWGREWPQIPGLIARIADRPGETDIWKILRRYRTDIEAQANRPLD